MYIGEWPKDTKPPRKGSLKLCRAVCSTKILLFPEGSFHYVSRTDSSSAKA